MKTLSEDVSTREIIKYLNKLENRISNIENRLRIFSGEESTIETPGSENSNETLAKEKNEDQLELRIGQFWLAKVGIVVLIIGFAFLLTLPYENFPLGIPSLIGFLLAGSLALLSRYGKNNFPYICSYLTGGAFVLLYFATLRLHFFSLTSIFGNIFFEIILLLIISAITLAYSIKKRSVYFSALSLTFAFATAIVSDNSFFLFFVTAFLSALVIYLKIKFQWQNLVIYGIVLAFFTHLLWFLNNPVIGKTFQLVSSPDINVLFLLLYASIFLFGNYMGEKTSEDYHTIISNALSIVFSYGLFLLITFIQYSSVIGFYHLTASIIFLMFSVLYWTKFKSKYSTFILAMTGYLALSVAIIIQFELPNFFIWLCWQSLLVLSTSVWFRSRFIVTANFIIYLLIIIAYLVYEGKINAVSISYGVVALLSARILNWKKDKLELKTEYMRNFYLLIALLIIPYALYNVLPPEFVGLSWLAVAIIYYALNIILKNKKYRWMALLTLLLTVVYVFILGISSSSSTYKIVSFLILGIVLILLSIIYSRNKLKAEK
ncbi:MAG: hypothetical protein A2057_02285 [Ignavibacteria bacterium GWA2_35_9]|nr:MAG: hypothetical protein A2057_02285 [Ignavibacteria bacterium GWA2_35_9]OGU49089.1 MAG: hypothetical protein A2080_11235 [Ignavibacteria bacterium GWC2_36_12]